MPRTSAGILLHRRGPDGELQVLAGHMGGPFWARKDAGAWTLPKGEHGPEEDPLAAGRREFAEELGVPVPATELVPLGEVRQSGGKRLTVWAGGADLDVTTAVLGTFTMEWPPRSGRVQEFPELDRVAWLTLEEAREKLVRGQIAYLDRLLDHLGISSS